MKLALGFGVLLELGVECFLSPRLVIRLAVDLLQCALDQLLMLLLRALARGPHVEQGGDDGREGEEKTNAPVAEESRAPEPVALYRARRT